MIVFLVYFNFYSRKKLCYTFHKKLKDIISICKIFTRNLNVKKDYLFLDYTTPYFI